MAWAALDLGDGDVGVAVTEGDAVVTYADDRLGDEDVGWAANVNAVGVGAIVGSRDVEIAHLHVCASVDSNMVALAVHQLESIDSCFCTRYYLQRLHSS